MLAILCRTCGQRHWGRVCDGSRRQIPTGESLVEKLIETPREPRKPLAKSKAYPVKTPAIPPVLIETVVKQTGPLTYQPGKPGKPGNPAFIDPETGRYSHKLYVRARRAAQKDKS